MGRNPSTRIQRAGAYVVKSAESPSARVPAKAGGPLPTPTSADKQLVAALWRAKRAA
jgi:hypothetical protein